jgi:hypothetical protein
MMGNFEAILGAVIMIIVLWGTANAFLYFKAGAFDPCVDVMKIVCHSDGLALAENTVRYDFTFSCINERQERFQYTLTERQIEWCR